MRRTFFLLIIAAVFGCSPKVSAPVLMPSHADISGFRDVAVMPFSGSYGEQITPAAENVIVSAEVNGVSYFNVADRQNLNRIIQEQKLQVSGLTDERTAVRLGRLAGVRGIFTGNAEKTVSSTGYSEQRTKCGSTDKKGKCLSYYDYRGSCVKKRAFVVFIPKLINAATGLGV